MWKSIFYKEWIKIRWFLIGITILGLAVLGYIFLKVQYNFTFITGKFYWFSILFQRIQYFEYLRFWPLAGGVIVGFVQYIPETLNKRIKLTFHLPLGENKALMLMHAFGSGCLALSYLLILSLFFILSKFYFASEIIIDAGITIFPWFLAGFTAYYMIAFIILEPMWKYRIFFLITATFLISIYLYPSISAGYGPANPWLFILTVGSGIAVIFSAYRFRRGEM